MKNYPTISIAIPVYNSDKFLEKCLDSVISQTYKNLEIVVLNNDSTDSSYEIICRYQEKDSRIKYYSIPHVPTETWSRNNAYLKTTAEWIVPVDSDDAIEPEYIEKLWQRHLETGAEWVGATMTIISDNEKIIGRIPKLSFDYSQVLEGRKSVILTLDGWKINGNGALIHRSLIPCIESGVSKPQFNVEYDTRVILYKAKTVAFVDAKYYFGYNPNSVGRKLSFTKLSYDLHSFVGLLPFIQSHYDSSSKEVQLISSLCSSTLIPSFKVYLSNKELFTKVQRKEYKSMCCRLFADLHYKNVKEPIGRKIAKLIVNWLNIVLLRIFCT